MTEGDTKTVNDITVCIDRITETTVHYTRFHAAPDWDGDEWPFWKADRVEFEELWEAEK